MKFTIAKIQEALDKKSYQFFDTRLNIIGVRSSQTKANVFDDWLYIIYPENTGKMIANEFQITTDPGTYWLENPLSVDGTAILVPGQYIDSHTLGLHRKKYEAIVQQKPLKVWRDNNKDNIIDTNGKTYEGIYGINIHSSNPKTESSIVEKWSAGCQVFKKVADFNLFMDVCKKSEQKSFTYTLLEESDF
ncbi:hypothetical protein Q4Q35_11930 [Flavivirga aquimarina]|uniref:YkuD domain-containing protein n=1 Tax=Flavivirga aquimarina TaxID=2027862 RepID=A0ABT8WBN1_9FLAO|nr:hypothetical protein [Flavivirga aquimarina]MDO5970516.1 hypothetical protein [Flavivirga aquimarina]